MHAPASRPISLLIRDLSAGLNQQMFFWGKDVVHPLGNLFERTGFEKRPSLGLQGTSCYRLPWQGGAIELHGSYAGWITDEGGMFYIRPLGRCVRWLDSEPPIAGEWPRERYDPKPDEALYSMARPFLSWWLAHEAEVSQRTERSYRDTCYRQYKNLPRTRAWLRPDLITRWVGGLRDTPDQLPRAKRFAEHITS